jgi:hypothetical protein
LKNNDCFKPQTGDESEIGGLTAPEGSSEGTDCLAGSDPAGRFLHQWGKLADSFGWLPGDLFDVLRNGAMGLAWC